MEVVFLQGVSCMSGFPCHLGMSHVPKASVDKALLSPWSRLGAPVENQLTMHVRTCFWVLSFIPLAMSVLMPGPRCSDCCSSVCIWTLESVSSGAVLVQQFPLFGAPLQFHTRFRIDVCISTERKQQNKNPSDRAAATCTR